MCHVRWLIGNTVTVRLSCRFIASATDQCIEFMAKTKIPSYISAVIFPFIVLLLLSYAVLPAKYSHRHYLSVSFTIGICCMHVSRVVSLGLAFTDSARSLLLSRWARNQSNATTKSHQKACTMTSRVLLPALFFFSEASRSSYGVRSLFPLFINSS